MLAFSAIAAFLSENSQHIIDHATEFYITFYTAKYQQKQILTSSLVNWVFRSGWRKSKEADISLAYIKNLDRELKLWKVAKRLEMILLAFQTERTGTMAKRKVKMNGLWTVDKDQYPQEIIHRCKQWLLIYKQIRKEGRAIISVDNYTIA